jgi:hypothetical protein
MYRGAPQQTMAELDMLTMPTRFFAWNSKSQKWRSATGGGTSPFSRARVSSVLQFERGFAYACRWVH